MVHRQKHQLPDEPYGFLAAASMARPVPLAEARDVLRAGLSSAKWITVDDTGAHHKAVNGFCTSIGNAHFCLVRHHRFKEPRQLPRSAARRHDDYVINAEALAYMTSAPWPGR